MTEDCFFRELFGRLPPSGVEVVVPPGDDCAALRLGDGDMLTLVAVDQLVADRHYLAGGASPTPARLVGRKLLARNLSDIAAMGGTPRYCLVAASFSPDRTETWMYAFYDGIAELATEYGVAMVGGDLARAPHDDVSSLTILGEVRETELCRRSGATPGDLLFVTGSFGQSFTTGHHLEFQPRCREARWLASHGLVAAMIDVSDGLARDTFRLCQASGAGAVLYPDQIPRRLPATTLAEAFHDGEDYELVLAVQPRFREVLVSEWPFPEVQLTCIGHVVPGPPVLRDEAGRNIDIQGFDHLGHDE